MTYEMAEELGLISKPAARIWGSLPFESAHGTERRERAQEAGFRAELKRSQEKYRQITFRGNTYEII